MGDPFTGAAMGQLLTWASEITEEGIKYKSSVRKLTSTLKELNPVVEQIKQCNEKMDLPAEEDIQKLIEEMAASRELIRNTEIHWWNFFLAPCYQSKIERRDKALVRSIMVNMLIQMLKVVKDIQYKMSESHRQTTSADQTNNGTPTNGDRRIPQFTVGLDGPLVNQLKHELLKDGGKQVLNLTGMAGLGKTTLAKHLCRNPQVKGKFNDNIVFETLGSQIQSNDPGNQLQDRLSKFGENPVLLVLDDVCPVLKELVEQLIVQLQISSYSKILVTSRVAFTDFGTPYTIKPLSQSDAVTLFLHFVQPSEVISSYNDGDDDIREILLQIVEGCKGIPLALKFVGSKLRGQPIEGWKKMVKEWSEGHCILDSDTELLTCLQNSLHVLEDESMNECFMDLGLFPEGQRIPVTALIDMWVELYKLDEDGICAMIFIHQLTTMNLADIIVRRKVGSDADSYYNNHFLMQHGLLRELAIRISKKEIFEKRKRLIFDINGNNCPKWWPQQQQQHQGISAFIPEWLIASKQQSVAARILSISTDQKIAPDWCNIQATEAEVLVLNLHTKEYTLPEFMKKMRNLKVVIVINYGFHFTELKNFELLGSLSSLKRIRLQRISVPYLCELKNVQKLSLYMCEVKQTFENCSFEISKALPNLVDVNIDYCRDMVKLPAGLCDIFTLKKLSISSCHSFTELPKEIGKLENLELLRVSNCANFKEMPESMTRLQRLSFLDISYCVSLEQLPEGIDHLKNLRKLYIMGSSIINLPQSFLNLENLKAVLCDEERYALWEDEHPKLKTMPNNNSLDWLELDSVLFR